MAHVRKQCITLLMTNECNLDCDYCYLRDCRRRENQSIDLDFAKRGIQDFFSSSGSRHVRFYAAGEPTLEFEKIRIIHDFVLRVAGRELKTEIQTNGVFSKSIALWLADNIDIIWISVDGPPSIQDVQRPQRGTCKSSEIVESNIATILGHQPNVTVGARSTITPLNLYRQVEMVEHFCRLRLKAMFSDPVFPRIGNSLANLKSLDVGSDFMMEYAREFLKARRRAEELGIFYGSILTVNFDEKTEYFCRSCTPCPHLTTDGYVSCCDMAAFGDTLSQLIYGEYNAQTGRIGYDNKKIAAIRSRRASNLAACRGCKILYFCAGGCVGEGVNETGNLLGVKKAYCDAIRFLAKHIPLEAGLYPYLHP